LNKTLIRNGLIAAGLINIGGVLLFSRAFTNGAMNNADPAVMSNFGLLMIMVWGVVFLGATTVTSSLTWLAGAFAIEKFVYVCAWLKWISENSLAQLYEKDFFAGVFFTIYGPNDFMFMVFFAWVFVQGIRSK
jgi:hypothetical protein